MQLFTALGLGMTAGLSAFLPIFIIGCLARFTEWLTLPDSYLFLQSPWVIIFAGLLTIIEFVADKVPAIDHFWDSLQTFLRPVAGAVLAAATIGDASPGLILFAAIFGGGLAGAMHTSKATIRLMSTSTSGGLLNPIISLIEDILALVSTLLAVFSPGVMAVIVILFTIFMFWFVPKFWHYFFFRFSTLNSWLKWRLKQPALDTSSEVQLFGLGLKKLDYFRSKIDRGEEIQVVMKGQVWLRHQRKNIWLVVTTKNVRIFVRGLFSKTNWSYSAKEILACHTHRGITIQWDLVVSDQVISFEFLRMATPYVESIYQIVKNWISVEERT